MFNLFRSLIALVLFVILISGCDSSDKPTRAQNDKLIFQPIFRNDLINCDSVLLHSNSKWRFTQLQFYISSIELKNKAGKWQKAPLVKSPYQTDNSALLGEHCNSSNTKNKAKWSLIFDESAELANAVAMRFDLGLPFTVNHLNPLTQDSPLNIPTMFWSWQQGHKFLRLEMTSNSDNWLFHLGSVGCKAASPLRSPKDECRYPNRYPFELALNNENNQIIFDLSALLNNVLITKQTSCQSSPEKSSCKQLFENLKQTNAQSVYHLKSKI